VLVVSTLLVHQHLDDLAAGVMIESLSLADYYRTLDGDLSGEDVRPLWKPT